MQNYKCSKCGEINPIWMYLWRIDEKFYHPDFKTNAGCGPVVPIIDENLYTEEGKI